MRTRSRSVAVLLFDEVELLDVAAPLSVLSSAGRKWNWRPFKVTTVAAKPGPITTRNQLVIQAGSALDACRAPELLFLPGGYGARRAVSDSALVDWVREAGQAAGLVMTVGHGALLAAKAGLADGRDLAVPADSSALLAEVAPGARARVDAPGVVESDQLLSAAHSAVALELALAAVSRLLGRGQALGVAAALGHEMPDAEPPVRIDVNAAVDPSPGRGI